MAPNKDPGPGGRPWQPADDGMTQREYMQNKLAQRQAQAQVCHLPATFICLCKLLLHCDLRK